MIVWSEYDIQKCISITATHVSSYLLKDGSELLFLFSLLLLKSLNTRNKKYWMYKTKYVCMCL